MIHFPYSAGSEAVGSLYHFTADLHCACGPSSNAPIRTISLAIRSKPNGRLAKGLAIWRSAERRCVSTREPAVQLQHCCADDWLHSRAAEARAAGIVAPARDTRSRLRLRYR
jgi:hypothetical protein